MPLNVRILLSVAVLGSAGVACQQLDTNASSGGAATAPAPVAAVGGDLTSWQLCQSPSCDSPDGDVPVLLATPPIYLPDAATTTVPCDNVELLSLQIRKTYCASCHESPASQAGLSFVLDDKQLSTALSQTAFLPDGGPLHMVVPGNPYASWLYQVIQLGMSGSASGMPPVAQPGAAAIPRPSAADLSVLYGWILACVPGATASGGGGSYVTTTGGYGPGTTAGSAADAATTAARDAGTD